MIYSSEADIVQFVKGLVHSLQPYAVANSIKLAFSTTMKSRQVIYHPFHLSQSVTQLICNLINLLPPQTSIIVRLEQNDDNQNLRLEIENTGLNLIHIPEVISNSVYSFKGNPLSGGTIYVFDIQAYSEAESPADLLNQKIHTNDPPQFYREIQKRFTQNFTRTEKLISALEKNRPQEAAFMQKINTLVKVNIENENFGTDDLCKAMFLSRTQLFRKMKSLINQAPANYIKSVRLQKAKELLESSELTISEVAYKVGFLTINHFTKVFKEEYGIPPSVYRHNSNSATNR
jgi:AraC-like DNA-binding protein